MMGRLQDYLQQSKALKLPQAVTDWHLIDNFRQVIIAISRWKAGKLDIEDTQFPFCTQYQNLF